MLASRLLMMTWFGANRLSPWSNHCRRGGYYIGYLGAKAGEMRRNTRRAGRGGRMSRIAGGGAGARGACYHSRVNVPPATHAAIAEFAEQARARFGSRLRRLALFGSHARGEATEDSDVDLLVLLDPMSAADGRAVDTWVGDILTRTDVLLSPLLLSASRFDELRARQRRIALEIDRDARPV